MKIKIEIEIDVTEEAADMIRGNHEEDRVAHWATELLNVQHEFCDRAPHVAIQKEKMVVLGSATVLRVSPGEFTRVAPITKAVDIKGRVEED